MQELSNHTNRKTVDKTFSLPLYNFVMIKTVKGSETQAGLLLPTQDSRPAEALPRAIFGADILKML